MIIIISPYEVDGTLSCRGSKMSTWKVGDVVYELIFLHVVTTFHTFHSDVFERPSVRLKQISYYALRLIFNRVLNINLLVLNLSFDFGHAKFGFFARSLVIVSHLDF